MSRSQPKPKVDFQDPEFVRALIRSIVRAKNEPLFTDLMEIEGFCGDEAYISRAHNIVVWRGLSKECQAAINYLFGAGEIEVVECRPEVYIADGRFVPSLPVARGIAYHDRLHWLPCKFREKQIMTGPPRRSLAESVSIPKRLMKKFN